MCPPPPTTSSAVFSALFSKHPCNPPFLPVCPPHSAIPQLPPGPVSAQQLRAARDHLQDMIASFLSAGL